MDTIGIKCESSGRGLYAKVKDKYDTGDGVIVKTERGIEFGQVTASNFNCCNDCHTSFIEIERKANSKDIEKNENLKKKASDAIPTMQSLIIKHKLDMKLIDIEILFDESKMIFNFTANGRIDFRELVKDLAGIYKTRIELRQIGVRDETKKIGGIGPCGRECCCKLFLNNVGDVAVKMAKNQNLSLNPSKISGLCGRLMCCLGYENEFYVEALKQMPMINSDIETIDGKGIVYYNDLLKKIVHVKIRNEDDSYEIKQFSLNQITKMKTNKVDDNEKDDEQVLKDVEVKF